MKQRPTWLGSGFGLFSFPQLSVFRCIFLDRREADTDIFDLRVVMRPLLGRNLLNLLEGLMKSGEVGGMSFRNGLGLGPVGLSLLCVLLTLLLALGSKGSQLIGQLFDARVVALGDASFALQRCFGGEAVALRPLPFLYDAPLALLLLPSSRSPK